MSERATADDVLREVLRVQDLVTEGRGEALHIEQLRTAVTEGIRAAASDPQMWAAAMGAIQNKAAVEAGGWLFGGLRALLSRAAWVLVIGMGVYLLGGWGALASLIKGATH